MKSSADLNKLFNLLLMPINSYWFIPKNTNFIVADKISHPNPPQGFPS
jgi:hypothetical protein